MLSTDLLFIFFFMGVLFLRQIFILKQLNKINYAPLMLGIGAIGSIVHFLLQPQTQNVIYLLRESFFPLLISLILFVIMNILHQNQHSESTKVQQELTKALISQVNQLKEYIAELETKMILSAQEDVKAKESTREQFKQDIKTLDAIQINQIKFLDKFDEISVWHKDVSKAFDHFKDIQLPELDNVVHKHIDMLRVSEEEHYKKVKTILEKAVNSRDTITEDIDDLKHILNGIKNISNTIAKEIIHETVVKLSEVSKSFENQILSLKSHAESINTSLFEDENRLEAMREQSEIVMKQLSLSSNKIVDMESQNDELASIFESLKELLKNIYETKADYEKSKIQLSIIAKELKASEKEQINAMKSQIESLGEALTNRIEDSLKELHEHYHIANDDISKSVQILAKKAQIKGYTQLDD